MTEAAVITRPPLSDIHHAYLNDHAITDEVIREVLIWSSGDKICFGWNDSGTATVQTRIWPEPEGGLPPGMPKYLWAAGAAGHPSHLWAIRPVKAPAEGEEPGPVIIAEGTKQSLAVASWAPAEYAVYGMSGCDGWRNLELARLDRFAGRKVVIMLDADAGDNLNVYEGGEGLAAELLMEDATQAEFVPSPSWGKGGIDDYLAAVTPTRRQERLAKLLAATAAKPAERKPRNRKISEEVPDTGNRLMVVVNGDRLGVIQTILGHMRLMYPQQLFSYGGAITRLRGHTTEPLDKDSFTRWMAQVTATYKYKPPGLASPGSYEAAWPEPQTIGAMLSSGDEFPALERISRSPFIRPDGSICAKNGYDEDSHAMLVMGNSGMDRLDIPDEPTQAEAAVAASYLMDEWLGDMPWKDDASRAGALALALTPFIRGLVPLVPLAVISGLQMGVGKNLLADCLSIMITGDMVQTMPWIPDDDDENRKQILSAFRAGTTLFCLDEAHEIRSTALARAITSTTYADRILGVSKMASYPNTVTWMALGNQVQVDGDMGRRYYAVELYPEGPDPQDRDESSFTHPDLRGWTYDNRPELVTKALTLIRAWFAAAPVPGDWGPLHPRGTLMGSFEPWDKMVSGILGHAGVSDFLGNLAARRAERDTTGGFWAEHLAWLVSQFGNRTFVTADVQAKAMASGGNWEAPPRPNEPAMTGFTRELGKEYAKNSDRWYGRYRLVREGLGHGSTAKWRVHEQEENLIPPIPPIPPTGSVGNYPSGYPQPDLGGRDGRDQIPNDRNVPGYTPLANTIGGVLEGHILPEQGRFQGEGSDMQTPMPTRPAETPQEGGMGGIGGITSTSLLTYAGARVYAHVREGEGLGHPSDPLIPPGPAIGFDLETADADDIFRSERGYVAADGAGFVRLAGLVGPGGNREIVTVRQLLAIFGAAGRLDGHNILGFDGLALAQHHGMDWASFARKARDSELIARQVNPPRSRESGSSEDKYDLDHVAAGLGVAGKTDDLGRLKAKFGGWDKIPLDDEEYRSYLFGDLGATHAVSGALNPYYDADPYLAREHKLAAIAGQMTLNGFLVDRELLAQRAEQTSHRKQQALGILASGWGLPLTKPVMRGRGAARHEEQEPVESPLATDTGRDWLAGQWERYQVPAPPLTGTGKLAIGGDDLKRISSDPRCPDELRTMLTLMGIVTASRTVYQTATDWLCPDGRVHPKISMRQASGRWSVTKPGLTVFGKRGGRYVERAIFLPDPGHVLLSFDLSQVDMRAMAGHSQDPAYMAMFGFGPDGKPLDAHAVIAEQVGLSRQDSKPIGHGWNYGLGAKRMIADGMDPEKVYRFINGMEARFPRLIGWREEIRAQGKAGMILDNGFGRRMRCEPSRAYTVAPALMGQGGARDIMCECLLRLPAWVYPFLRAMVHDEIVMSVPLEAVQDVIRVVTEAMTWFWRGVPVLCDTSKPGSNWGEISAK